MITLDRAQRQTGLSVKANRPLTYNHLSIRSIESPGRIEASCPTVENPVKPYIAWSVVDASYKSYIPLEVPRKNPKTGKMEKVQVINHHLVEVRNRAWPDDISVIIRRTRGGYSIKFPNGEREAVGTISTVGLILAKRYGESNARTIIDLLA